MGTNYYVRTAGCGSACEHCSESRLIHLGKTSAGWRFLFQADPEWPPTEATERWRQLAESGAIEDEYGQPATVDELLTMAEARRDLRSHLDPQPDIGIYRTRGDYFEVGGHEFTAQNFS